MNWRVQALQIIGSEWFGLWHCWYLNSALLALDKLLQAKFIASLIVNDVVEYHGLVV